MAVDSQEATDIQAAAGSLEVADSLVGIGLVAAGNLEDIGRAIGDSKDSALAKGQSVDNIEPLAAAILHMKACTRREEPVHSRVAA